MANYAILNRNENQDVGAIVRPVYPDAYIWSPQVAFVRDSAGPQEVSKKIDMINRIDDSQHTGQYSQMVVIQVSPSYWGHTDIALWNWLKESFEASS